MNAETLIGLVSHYSPSGQEQEAVEWLMERMKSLGFTNAFVDDVGNVVGVMGNGPRQVVLLGHIDTVPGEIKVEQIGHLLHGRGAVDAKGPLACFVDAVAQVGEAAGWQLIVIGAVEEERDSDGARFIVDKYRPDFLIVGEPSRWDRLALGYKGSAWAQVTVRREQRHAASGEQTAAEAAVELWLRVRALAAEFNQGKGRAFDQILPALRAVEAGEEAFSQWARLKIGARLPPEVRPEMWYARLQEIAGEAEVERLGYPVPAWVCKKNTLLVRALLTSIRAEGGQPIFVYKMGTADLNIVAPAWGCPAVVYGPGDSSFDHTPQEHIALEEYARAVHVLIGALRTIVRM